MHGLEYTKSMRSLLTFIAKAIRQSDIKSSDFQAGSHVLSALASTSKEQIKAALESAQASGMDLTQVGGIALLSNRKLVATVLKENFGLGLEDYTTSGGELGVDSQEGYPLLPYLAYMSNGSKEYIKLQKRALNWGANPEATWEIERPLPYATGKNNPKTVSWVSENIRALNTDFVEVLCDKIKAAPLLDEQVRRLNALEEAILRGQGDFFWDFRGMFELFAPGGKLALDISPWDVQQDKVSMAFNNTVVLTRINNHDDNGKSRALFAPWIDQTAPTQGDECMRIAVACVEQGRQFSSLPTWLVDKLTVKQAQTALKAAWPKIFENWAFYDFGGRSDCTINNTNETMAESNLRSKTSYLSKLTQLAIREPCANGADKIDFLIAATSAFNLSKISLKAVDAIASVYPQFPGAVPFSKQLTPLKELLEARNINLKSGSTAPYSDPDMDRFHQACVLRMRADQEAALANKESGVLYQPTRSGPRL